MMRCGLLIALWAAAGCATTTELAVGPAVSSGTLGPGDVFEVRVYGEPELSSLYRMGPDGTINFPLVGVVRADGLTPNELSLALQEKLMAYLKIPNVSVFVKEYNSKKVFVFGQVRNPGTFPYDSGMSVIQAITLAGGFDKQADKNGTQVTRRVGDNEIKQTVAVEDIGKGSAPNFELQPGDIVYVPESLF